MGSDQRQVVLLRHGRQTGGKWHYFAADGKLTVISGTVFVVAHIVLPSDHYARGITTVERTSETLEEKVGRGFPVAWQRGVAAAEKADGMRLYLLRRVRKQLLF